MTGPGAWDALRDLLAHAASAIADAKADLETARASLGVAADALRDLHTEEEELDERLRERGAVDVVQTLELYRHSDRVVGLTGLRAVALDQIASISGRLWSAEIAQTFALARAVVDTIGVELAELEGSYEEDPDRA